MKKLPKKKPPNLTNCKKCGRDTANKGGICSACLSGEQAAPPPRMETHYEDDFNGPLEEE